MADDINFCPRCGHPLERRLVYGAERPVCPSCGRIHFFDPKVAVGVVIKDAGRLLLIKRGNDPERGKWSVPAGFVDAGEDPARAAEREAFEETGLRVRVTGLLDVYARVRATEGADILIVYLAQVTAGQQAAGGQLRPGDDAEAAAYFDRDHLPELAFDSTEQIVARFLASQ
jgi:ADP-ribose pyrophosphatase YjhB (NUDIX family)